MRFFFVVFVVALAASPAAFAQPSSEDAHQAMEEYKSDGSSCEDASATYFQWQRLVFAVKAVEAKAGGSAVKKAEKNFLWARGAELRHYGWLLGRMKQRLETAEAKAKAVAGTLAFKSERALRNQKKWKQEAKLLRLLIPQLEKAAGEDPKVIPWAEMSGDVMVSYLEQVKGERQQLRHILTTTYYGWFGPREDLEAFRYECVPYNPESLFKVVPQDGGTR